MRAYKLIKVRADGSLGPLFINKKQRLPVGEWLEADDHPTRGYAHRPGWHCSLKPSAPWLSKYNRLWYEVEIDSFYFCKRPPQQGGYWVIAKWIRLLRPCFELPVKV